MLRLEDFLWGFAAGIVTAVIFGWLLGIYHGWIRERDSFRRPQSISQKVGKSPEQIYREFVRAEAKIWLARFVFVGFTWLSIELLLPGVAGQVRSFVARLFRWMVGT